MAIITESAPMTTAQWLAFPDDDGMQRWIINGELRERPTKRNRFHSKIMGLLAQLINNWRVTLPMPHGEVLVGEAGVRLREGPDSTVGVDVAYVQPELVPGRDSESTIIEGAPVLMVEILSPSELQKDIDEKIDLYLECGVRLVWIVDPHDRAVTVYETGKKPAFFNDDQELTGEPWLPGFRTPVKNLFE